MGIIRSIKERYKLKRKQERLIKTEDDDLVVVSLPAKNDNSFFDMHEIVKNMKDPKKRAKVVERNITEIAAQDSVKDTLKYLSPEDAMRIWEKNKNFLQRKGKTKNALDAIERKGKTSLKIKAIIENIDIIADLELVRILEELKPEKDDEKGERLEQQKRRIVTLKILDHVHNDKGIWHLKEMVEPLKKESVPIVLKMCLNTIYNQEQNDKVTQKIISRLKSRLSFQLLNLSGKDYYEKVNEIDAYIQNKRLTLEEGNFIKQKFAFEQILKDISENKVVDLQHITENLQDVSKIDLIRPILTKVENSGREKVALELLKRSNIPYEKIFSMIDEYKKDELLTIYSAASMKEDVVISQIIENIEQGKGSNLEQMSRYLDEASKVALADKFIIEICNYEMQERPVDLQTKTDLISGIYNLTKGNQDMKIDAVNRYADLNFLTEEGKNSIVEKLKEQEREEKKQAINLSKKEIRSKSDEE